MKKRSDQAGLSLLIVDDRVEFRQLIRHYLKESAMSVCECENGADAVLRYEESPFDCVVMDINMPVMDGLTATGEIIKQDPRAKIIIQTSDQTEELRERARNLGACAVIDKSSLNNIREVIQEIVGLDGGLF